MFTDHDITRWRLHSQRLVAPHAPAALDVVRGLLAVQAENPGQTAWAVACRTSDPDADDLRRLLDEGHVIRTHVLRPTWHYVAADDVRWLLDVTAPRIRALVLRQWEREHGLAAADLDRMSSIVLAGLEHAPDRTRDEVAGMLAAEGIDTSGGVLTALLAFLELDQLICSGRPRDGVHTYALFEHRVPPTAHVDRDESLATLALRYVTGHGPATEKDLAYWASLTLTDARRGLSLARDQLASFEHEGRAFWHARDAEPPTAPMTPRGHLLLVLDELYRGYQDSRMLLDTLDRVPRGRETALGMAVVDGQLVARMTRTVGRSVVFTLEPYGERLLPEEHRALEEAAARYGAFLGLDHVLATTA